MGDFTTDSREKYIMYVHIDVNLDGRGWLCCCSTFNSQKRNWWRSCLKSRPPALKDKIVITETCCVFFLQLGRDLGGSLDVPPPGGEHIIISNPFEDSPTAAPSLRSQNTLSRQLNQQMMNCHFNPYQNSFHTNMPPSGYNNSMYNNHSNSTNGPVQPVMYNSQGGPVFPCGTCHKEIGDAEAIHCRSSCNYWFHRTCVGLVETAYRLLTSEPLAEWVCDKCIREKKIPLVRLRTPQIAS